MQQSHTSASQMDLDDRPKARSFTIEELVDEVTRGLIRVPKFQREFLWDTEDARKLLDSIYRGYPVGTLLFWKRPGTADTFSLGTVKVNAPKSDSILWVVDGQQRITSLTRALAGVGFPEEAFAFFFDPFTREFRRIPTRTTSPPTFVPLNKVLNSTALSLWIDENREHVGDQRAVIFDLGRRIREYQIPGYVVATGNEDAVREIFRRVNTTGKQMEDADVFDALHGAKHEGQPSDLRSVSKSLTRLGFGNIPTPLLHKMLLATLGTEISKHRVPKLTPTKARSVMQHLQRVSRDVVHFLQRDAGVPHLELLPYEQPMIALARFFSLHRTPAPRTRLLLARWLWRGAVTGQHKGDALTTRQTLKAIVESNENASVQNLVRSLDPPTRMSRPVLEGFSLAKARSRIQTLALWSLDPCNLETGTELKFSEELLVPGFIVREGHTQLRQSLANRIVHPKTRRSLVRTICGAAPALLNTHCISAAAQEALQEGNFIKFLVTRELELERIVSDYVSEKVQWEHSDRPPVRSLIVSDEDEDA